MSLVCTSKCHLWQLLHIQGPNTTNRHVYQQETHLTWTWELTTGFRGESACAPKAAPHASLSATIQSSRATTSLSENKQGKKARVYVWRQQWGACRALWQHTANKETLWKGHIPTEWETESTIQSQGNHQEHLWASGRWDMRSERPLLMPGCHRRPQEDMPASPPHSVQLWPDPTASRAPGRACDNYLYAHLQGLFIELQDMQMAITVLPHTSPKGAWDELTATTHPTQASHSHTSAPGSDIPWESAMAWQD